MGPSFLDGLDDAGDIYRQSSPESGGAGRGSQREVVSALRGLIPMKGHALSFQTHRVTGRGGCDQEDLGRLGPAWP